MAFKLGDVIIDRIQMGVAEDFSGNLLYTLTQLADATIDITAESKDAVDKDGTLVKRFWNAKSGTFTANNAMLNLNIIAAKSGSDAVIASNENAVVMPRIVVVPAAGVNGGTGTIAIPGYVEGTVKVNGLEENGTMGDAYELSTGADATHFAISGSELTVPTAEGVTQYVVKYNRSVTNGASVTNSADKFPKTIKLTLKALCVDPCEADTLRSCYIVLPSFQPSPETSISLTTDGQLEFSGDLQVNYCSAQKELYQFFLAADDEED
jgi:hypothetical protein